MAQVEVEVRMAIRDLMVFASDYAPDGAPRVLVLDDAPEEVAPGRQFYDLMARADFILAPHIDLPQGCFRFFKDRTGRFMNAGTVVWARRWLVSEVLRPHG